MIAALLASVGASFGAPIAVGTAISPNSPTITLQTWFIGAASGAGYFRNYLDGTKRSFRVHTKGNWDGKVLLLEEDIDYWDGEHDVKIWHLTKTGPNSFQGNRADVIGLAKGVVDSSGHLHLTYSAKNEGRTLAFDDVLGLRSDGTVVNTIHVYYLLLPVGEAEIHFQK